MIVTLLEIMKQRVLRDDRIFVNNRLKGTGLDQG